jgi:hypothetical protein
MSLPPKIENAPGLKWRPIKAGWQARWRARTDLAKRGYGIKSIRLWESTTTNPEPDEITKRFIAERCVSMQDDMLTWAAAASFRSGAYNGTWGAWSTATRPTPTPPTTQSGTPRASITTRSAGAS